MNKDKFLCAVIVVLVLTMWIQYLFPVSSDKDRYEIVAADNMLTILLDKQTGETWRNCMCSKENQVPGCWEKMRTLDIAEFYLPKGEKVTRKKEMKILKKLQKVQAEAQQNQPAKEGAQNTMQIGAQQDKK